MAFFSFIRDRSLRPASAFVLCLSLLDTTMAKSYTAPMTSLVRNKDGNSLVYIFGGCSGEFRAIPVNDDEWPWKCTVISDYAFSYDPYTNCYRSLSNMPIAKYGHTATEVDGKIWVIGGRSGSDDKDKIDHQVDIYDIKKDSCGRRLGTLKLPLQKEQLFLLKVVPCITPEDLMILTVGHRAGNSIWAGKPG